MNEKTRIHLSQDELERLAKETALEKGLAAEDVLECFGVMIDKVADACEKKSSGACKMAETVTVIRTKTRIGDGTEENPVRICTQYWTTDGKLIGAYD